MENGSKYLKIAVVIPCYRVKDQILDVIKGIGPEVDSIYIVDDSCPEHTGDQVTSNSNDPRVKVIRHSENQGVGGATMTGFLAARDDGANIVVKMDGDGQMDPRHIGSLIRPLIHQSADCVKANRFFSPAYLKGMPPIRVVGNAVLSFFSKISTGYWKIMDPTNGFVGVNTRLLNLLPVGRMEKGYFFESDLLYQLSTIRAVVVDVPMTAIYQDEKSNLRIGKVVLPFLVKHAVRFLKRIIYSYYVRDFNIGSIELLAGLVMMGSGAGFGAWQWAIHSVRNAFTPIGTIMISTLPILIGFQLLLSFISYDILNEPSRPICEYL